MRAVVLWLLVVACESTNSRRDNGAKLADTPLQQQHAPAKVGLATPDGEIVVDVEVVSTPAKLMKGLMYREHLAPNAGMLFIMGNENDHAFYMRNTLIPLDMIFITKEMTIAGIVENAVPKTETLRSVGTPSLYVLEVNGGWTTAHRVTAGANVRFEGVVGAGDR